MSLISERQEDKGLSLSGAKTVQKNIEILIKREVKKKNHSTNRIWKSQWLYQPQLLLFPKKPRGHLETVVDCSRICGAHSGICSPEHPKKDHGG